VTKQSGLGRMGWKLKALFRGHIQPRQRLERTVAAEHVTFVQNELDDFLAGRGGSDAAMAHGVGYIY